MESDSYCMFKLSFHVQNGKRSSPIFPLISMSSEHCLWSTGVKQIVKGIAFPFGCRWRVHLRLFFPQIGCHPWSHPSKSVIWKPRKDILVLKYTGEVQKKLHKIVCVRQVWTTKWTNDTPTLVWGRECCRKWAGPEFSELFISSKSLNPFHFLFTLDRLWVWFLSHREHRKDKGTWGKRREQCLQY